MKKIFVVLSLGLSLFSLSVTSYVSDLDKVKAHYNDNLTNLKESYKDYSGIEWNLNNVEEVKYIYDEKDNKIGYFVDFDKGYVAFGNDNILYSMSTNNNPYANYDTIYYLNGKLSGSVSIDDNINVIGSSDLFSKSIFYKLYDYVEEHESFEFIDSYIKYPNLNSKFNQDSFLDYKPVTFYQGSTSDCGVMSIMDLLYTYKLSGSGDLTKGIQPELMRAELRDLTKWAKNIAKQGILPWNLRIGCNKFLDGKGELSLVYNAKSLTINCYSNLYVTQAHYAMCVGHAKVDSFFEYKKQLDIVTTWYNNYNVDSDGYPISINDVNICYRVVDSSYRLLSYALFKKNA